jgi:hypothetical protein
MSLGDIGISTINGGAIGVKNAIINGNFAVNQRVVSGTVTLAAGAYGHDRWKAGASGCTYTFATVDNVTTLTISAGSLIQVIEGLNLGSGTYTLSFTGTAQGKIGAGSFSGSGVTGAAVGGTNLNIEFNTGTLSLVQFEPGAIATPFERRPYGTELALCQRYYYRNTLEEGNSVYGTGHCQSTLSFRLFTTFPTTMRTAPSAVEQTGTAADYTVFVISATTCTSVPTFFSATESSAATTFIAASSLTPGNGGQARSSSGVTSYLAWSAEL